MSLRAFAAWSLIGATVTLAAPVRAEPTTQPADPGPITLELKDKSPEAAFEAFGQKIGVSFSGNDSNFWGQTSGPIDLACDQKPYWDVMKQLCRAAGVAPIESAAGQVKLMHDPLSTWAAEPNMICGPIRIGVSDLNVEHAVLLGPALQHRDSCELYLPLGCDPRVTAVYADPLKLETLLDESGRPIKTVSEQRPFRMKSQFGGGHAQCTIRIDPATTAHKISLLKGTVKVVLAAKSSRLEITDVLNAGTVTKEVGGVKLTFTAEATEGGARVKVTCERGSLPLDQWEHIEQAVSAVPPRLVDRGGHPYRIGGSGGMIGDRQLNQTWTFVISSPDEQNDSKPDRFTWDLPIEFRELAIAVEFKDLPLQ